MYLFIFNEPPKCKTCGKPMKEWNPWGEEFEHVGCTAERVSDSLMAIVKKQFNQL